MDNIDTKSLDTAIESLHATHIADDKYAYFDDASRRYWLVRSADLRMYSERYLGEPDGYSLWCASTVAREMPADWTPGDRI